MIRRPPARLRQALAEAWQIVRGVVGEQAYENYVRHQRTHHPDRPLMTEREFWRHHTDARDRNPKISCC